METSQSSVQLSGTASLRSQDLRKSKSELRKAALKGDWKKAEAPLERGLYNAKITDGGETALHLAAVEGHYPFVSNLLDNGSIQTRIPNSNGSTALSLAAGAGHLDIAMKLADDSTGHDEVMPLYMAVLRGHMEMANFLLTKFDFKGWQPKDQVTLLMASVESGLYGLAEDFLKHNDSLAAVLRNGKGWAALEVLARSPSAFCANKQQGLWATIIGFLKCNKGPETCSDAYGLLHYLWDIMMTRDVEEGPEISAEALRLPFIAAESGNDGFLVELINQHPDFLYNVNESNLSIFHIAVKCRYVRIFNLIYELNSLKNLMTRYVEEGSGNNILHLAAKIAPQNYLNAIPSPPLQMQREVLWYKEVEKIVQPSYRNLKNNNENENEEGQTPKDLFLAEHEKLMKEGEKCMKQTAKSCMLVTILITTLVFTTAFTLPGGYDNKTGAPILKNKRFFKVFPISQAVATLSSLASTVMFLSVLTSRYEKTDFLKYLPCWLVIGVAMLLLSIVAMMVEFCTCLLFFEHDLATIIAIVVLFVSVPITFVIFNYSLLVTILGSTWGGPRLFRSENRLFPPKEISSKM